MKRHSLLAPVVGLGLVLAACGDPEPVGQAVPPPPDTANTSDGATEDVTDDATDDSRSTTSTTDVARPNGPFDPGATLEPDLMVILPSIAEVGQEVEVTYPGGRDRGVAYVLEGSVDSGWVLTHYMTAVTDGYGTEPTWVPADDAEGYGVEDIGVGGEGPDRLVVPTDAVPGAHRICTANSLVNICAEIDIVAEGEGPIPVEPDGGIGDGAGPLPTDSVPTSPEDEPAVVAPGADPDAALAALEKYVGLSIEEFTAEAEASGYTTRIVARDGEEFDVTMDYREDRVNVVVEGPRVVEIRSIG